MLSSPVHYRDARTEGVQERFNQTVSAEELYDKTGIQELTGKRARVIHIVGGGTKDGFLSQMTADACGIPVAAGPEEATAIGNLMMQLIALGEVKDLGHARAIVADSFALKHYSPIADREAWEAAYAKFCTLN